MQLSKTSSESRPQSSGRAFRSEAAKEVETQFNELEAYLEDLDLRRTARISTLILEATAQISREKDERELVKLQQLNEFQEKKLKHEQETQQRTAQIKEAEARAEKERQKLVEAEREQAAEQKRREEESAKQKQLELEKKQLQESQEKAAKLKAEADAKQRAEQEKARANAAAEELARKKAQEEAEARASRGGSNRAEIDAEYKRYMDQIQYIKTNVKSAMASQPREVKNETMDIKLQLRPKFGMLTNSKSQLIQCRDGIKGILSSVKGNQLIYQWVLNLYAKLLVEQSESEANVKHQNALPLAMLTILLWDDFPEMGDFVIPRFIKRCPQLIGYYCSIDTADGRKKMGWKRDEDTGKYETEEQYMGRLSGICAVWSCMTQTKLAASTGDHPYPMSHSWKFLARQLNKPAKDVANTDYALVAAWWDMTAMRFHDAFGKQAVKVLDLLWQPWTGDKMDPPAMRLRGLGENWKFSGKLEAAWKPLMP